MEFKKRIALVHVGTRISQEIRAKAKTLAEEKKVKEADVYRVIITSFFDESVNKKDTKMSM